jgi:RimJ/RimL family protein N-acetyltransferase
VTGARQRAAQPLGTAVDATPARRPGPETLTGRYGRIEKLERKHSADLWTAVEGYDALWTYMPSYGPFADAATFSDWVGTRAALEDPYSYVVVDPSGRAIGVIALLEVRCLHRVIEVGHVVYSPGLQRTRLASEAQYLLARHVFETLGYRRYEWKCDALNTASRKAALRYGFTFEGVFRQHMISKGRNRDTAWYSMLDGEWPVRKASFERWLAPENFTLNGEQKRSLSSLNGILE